MKSILISCGARLAPFGIGALRVLMSENELELDTLGKETIDLYNASETRSNQKRFGLNYQKTWKELMCQDEFTVMEGGKCIFQLRGVCPFLADKLDITKHKSYKLLEGNDKRNFFDIQKYLATREKVKLRKHAVVTRMNIQLD